MRKTPSDIRLVDFVDGTVLRENELDVANIQSLYIAQEVLDHVQDVIIYDPVLGYFDARGCRITNVGSPAGMNDVITLDYFNEVLIPQIRGIVDTFVEESATTIDAAVAIQMEGVRTEFGQLKSMIEAMTSGTEESIAKLIESVTAAVDAKKAEALDALDAVVEEAETAITALGKFRHVGEWQADTAYVVNNVVTLDGSSYMLVSGDGKESPTLLNQWKLAAKKGDNGVVKITVEEAAQALSDTKEDKSRKGKPDGYAPLNDKREVPTNHLPKRVVQLDLAIPNKFAATTTATALASVAKDYCSWQLGPAKLTKVMARCGTADTGATPASVYLILNGAQVGTPLTATASSWSTQDLTSLSKTMAVNDQIEIGVSATGTNKNSENLRLVVVAELTA